MKLTEAHKNQVHAWLGNKAPSQPSCPVCQQTNWRIADRMVGMPIAGEKASMAVPMISLECANCGHAQFFFAKAIGLDV